MAKQRWFEIIVGLFMIAGFIAIVALALQVSGLKRITGTDTYEVTATFNNLGGLRVNAPVKTAGVEIGYVRSIVIDPKTYEAKVTLALNQNQPHLPADSSASILTEGLLGSKFISLEPGFSDSMLHQNDKIKETHSAMILENLIGQFIYNTKKD